MIITIIEKEILLANDISDKLRKSGYKTEVFDCIKKASKLSTGDVYLLSTVFSMSSTKDFIQKFKQKTILLLVSHKSHETLTEPIKLGAKDYIMKPVSMDILIKKIEHYQEFEKLKFKNALYGEYHEYVLKDIALEEYIDQISFPMIIITNNIAYIDQLVLAYGKRNGINIMFISLNTKNWRDKIHSTDKDQPLYFSGLESLNVKERNTLFNKLEGRRFIISSFNSVNKPYKTIEIVVQSTSLYKNEILPISGYALMVIKSLQHRMSDIAISEKLGYTRKKVASLRKKYELFKDDRLHA
jgi:hypothetical protein